MLLLTDHALLSQLGSPNGDWETFLETYYLQVERIAAKYGDEAQDAKWQASPASDKPRDSSDELQPIVVNA